MSTEIETNEAYDTRSIRVSRLSGSYRFLEFTYTRPNVILHKSSVSSSLAFGASERPREARKKDTNRSPH